MIRWMELLSARRRHVGLASGLVLATVAILAIWIALGLGGAQVTLWVDDLSTPIAAALACALCLRARTRYSGDLRLSWTLLACATACWTAAELVWGVYALLLDAEVPSPSWADVGYLLAIPLTLAALIKHPAISGGGTRKLRSVLDGLLIATALLFLSWTVVLGPLWHSTDLSTLGGLVTLAYPFGDAVIVLFVVLAIRGMSGEERRSLWFLLAALLAMALSDSLFTYLTEIAGYQSSSANVIDVGWIAAYLGIGLAAFSASGADVRVMIPARSAPSLVSLVAPLLPVLIALSATAVEIKLGHHLDRPDWLMAFGLIALVLVRQGLLILELLRPAANGEGLSRRLTEAAVGGYENSNSHIRT
jgi:hypothetical protein